MWSFSKLKLELCLCSWICLWSCTADPQETPTGAWTDMAPTSAPSARMNGTAVYETRDKTMMIFGGLCSATEPCAREVWQYYGNNNVWTRKWQYDAFTDTQAPPALYGHTAVWSSSDEMLVVGGKHDSGWSRQFWGYSLITNMWYDYGTTDEAVPILYGHSAVWDNGMVIFGGAELISDSEVLVNHVDVYKSSEGSWGWVNPGDPSGSVPSARKFHAAVQSNNGMLVFGGEGAGGVLLGDFWKHLGFRRLEVSVSQGNAMI
eukprot:symbB.v1.2.007481.t1/scaffold410.1/size210127/8